MADWGAGWANLSREMFAMSTDSIRGMQQEKAQAKRDEAARLAEEQRTKARQEWEMKVRNMDKKEKQNTTFQTFVNPQTGAVERITQGEVEGGTARVPQHVLDAQRAAAEQQAIVDAEKRGLTVRKTEADIAQSQASAQASRARAGLSQARMENPERFRAPSQSGEADPPLVVQARKEFDDPKTPAHVAHAAAAAKYGSDVADKAFPGVAQSNQGRRDFVGGLMGRFTQGGGTAQGADDINALLNKYTQSQ